VRKSRWLSGFYTCEEVGGSVSVPMRQARSVSPRARNSPLSTMLALGFTSHGGDQQSEAPPAVRAQRDGAPHTYVIGGRAVDLKSTDGMSQKNRYGKIQWHDGVLLSRWTMIDER
jgi:hypothetical protein